MQNYIKYYGDEVQRLARASDPEDLTTGERHVKGKGWVKDPNIIGEARFSGEWTPVTPAEAKAAEKAR